MPKKPTTTTAKKMPSDPYDLKSQEEFAKNYWGQTYDRHGIFSNPVIDVTWDNISEPLSAFGWDISNGYLTTDSIPSILDGKIFWGMNGSELNPSFAFTNEINTGWWLGQSPSSLNASVLGSWKVAIQDADFTHFNRLVFSFTNTHDIGGDGTVPPEDNQVLCPRNILAGNHFYLYSGSIFWNRIVGVSTSNQTHTLQDNSGTIYETGGLDVAIEDGGTNASTATEGFDNLAPTTTKGDIIVHDGSDNVREAVGTDNDVLVSDSTTSTGVAWKDGSEIPGFNGVTYIYQTADETRSGVGPTFSDHGNWEIPNAESGDRYMGGFVFWYNDDNSPSGGGVAIPKFVPAGGVLFDLMIGVVSGYGVPSSGLDSTMISYDGSPMDYIVVSTGTQFVKAVSHVAFSFTCTDAMTPGTIAVQWAKFSVIPGMAAAVRLFKGSYMYYSKV